MAGSSGNSPFPVLRMWPGSGLSFPFACVAQSQVEASGDSGSLGPDGMGWGLEFWCYWKDLLTALPQLLGYSYREQINGFFGGPIDLVSPNTSTTVFTLIPHGLSSGQLVVISGVGSPSSINGSWYVTIRGPNSFVISVNTTGQTWDGSGTWAVPSQAKLHRILPWRHPWASHLWVQRIANAVGVQSQGNSLGPIPTFLQPPGGGAGIGDAVTPGLAPWAIWTFAKLTLQFWRPPYYVRTDQDIIDPVTFRPREWLRYVDKNWREDTQLLSRNDGAFFWFTPAGVPGPATGTPFVGRAGRKVMHQKVSRTWYQIPEAGIFEPIPVDGTPNGQPINLLYTQTSVLSAIINNLTYQGRSYNVDGTINDYGNPILGCVNSQIGGQQDTSPNNKFFGAFPGTLLLESCEARPRPLQLPPALMQIPIFGANEPLSQEQYDITFHWDMFDPPRVPGLRNFNAYTNFAWRGHNLFSWVGNGGWYLAVTPQNYNAANVGPFLTAFDYADFSDLFQIR